ncbi:PREDICTED: adenylate kinase isoenzyme 6-like [Priapulus caudatus]|uniref:Adenylate kinase isoenzyme 6 homolog n=1 Tax=Priapulus caudatus TaxID=37621 RepID=A0ABM1EZR7_PRICU|nr:PREDICTED: adenylate kinase isoenzyme 6-like [Priapulus caudatus]
MAASARKAPNILITGTPGTGKSTLAGQVAERTGLHHIDVGAIAKDSALYDGYDDEYDCPVIDDDRIVDELEDKMAAGGNVVDYHGCDFFPERWFDVVFVLRVDNTLLYDRLVARGYAGRKLADNVECEILQTIVEEARESYASEIVHELRSDAPDDVDINARRTGNV